LGANVLVEGKSLTAKFRTLMRQQQQQQQTALRMSIVGGLHGMEDMRATYED